jgi:N-acetyl-anhydromuramyl-L-alanine amidase AmpD
MTPKAPVKAKVESVGLTIQVPNKDGTLREVPVPFVAAYNFTPITGVPRSLDFVVVHCTENPDVAGLARANANIFSRKDARKASFHYVLDNTEVIQCVKDTDVAWHAPGANHNGIGVEIVGKAGQTQSQWADDFSRVALYNAMGLIAYLCRKYAIPPLFVDAENLTKTRGITRHSDVTKAFPKLGCHWDPGPNFPIEAFINGVQWMMMRLENPTAVVTKDAIATTEKSDG